MIPAGPFWLREEINNYTFEEIRYSWRPSREFGEYLTNTNSAYTGIFIGFIISLVGLVLVWNFFFKRTSIIPVLMMISFGVSIFIAKSALSQQGPFVNSFKALFYVDRGYELMVYISALYLIVGIVMMIVKFAGQVLEKLTK